MAPGKRGGRGKGRGAAGRGRGGRGSADRRQHAPEVEDHLFAQLSIHGTHLIFHLHGRSSS